uniref:Uncharacterized protein n=1 Tax=Cucumis melo TaxID=3656 RepID=A0A9I9EIV3_CUCME
MDIQKPSPQKGGVPLQERTLSIQNHVHRITTKKSSESKSNEKHEDKQKTINLHSPFQTP